MQSKRAIREIKSSDWPEFCRQVTGQRAGAMVKLDFTNSDGVKSEVAASASFQGLIYDQTGDCNNVIKVRLQSGREMVHEIVEPIQIWLHSSGGAGDFNPLEIKAESGLTSLSFHPAIHEQMLDGI